MLCGEGVSDGECAGHDSKGKGGTNGQGGGGNTDRDCGSGAGFAGDGSKYNDSRVKNGALSFRNGATGGLFNDGSHGDQAGGFGGGGYGGWGGAGGGGGYNGGGSPENGTTFPCGGGGGSFNSGSNPSTDWGGGGGHSSCQANDANATRVTKQGGHNGSGQIEIEFLKE